LLGTNKTINVVDIGSAVDPIDSWDGWNVIVLVVVPIILVGDGLEKMNLILD
jgi:hypothetical protein